jgi:hypothetical protein
VAVALVRAGADTLVKNKKKKTPLDLAKSKALKLVLALERRGWQTRATADSAPATVRAAASADGASGVADGEGGGEEEEKTPEGHRAAPAAMYALPPPPAAVVMSIPAFVYRIDDMDME